MGATAADALARGCAFAAAVVTGETVGVEAIVSGVVGGTEAQEKYAGQDGERFAPLPRTRQKEAVRFLAENAFATPTHFLREDILRLIEVEGALRRINQSQTGILNTLLNDRRMERLIEFERLRMERSGMPPGEVSRSNQLRTQLLITT